MDNTFKFPGGKDVKVVRKSDIIDCIDSNIIDKEIALAIVEQCEVDAVNFLRKGRWVGIPFIGSIRPSKIKELHKSEEQQKMIAEVRENATTEQYVLFRKDLAHENERRIKAQRMYNYILSMAVARNRQGFKKLVKERGEQYARVHFFLTYKIFPVDSDIEIEYVEDSND